METRDNRPQLWRAHRRVSFGTLCRVAIVCSGLLALTGFGPAAALANTGSENVQITEVDASHYSVKMTDTDPTGTNPVDAITFNTTSGVLTGATVAEAGWPCSATGVGDAQICSGSGTQNPGEDPNVMLMTSQPVVDFKVCATTNFFVTEANTTCQDATVQQLLPPLCPGIGIEYANTSALAGPGSTFHTYIAGEPLPSGPYDHFLASGGQSPYSFSLAGGSLPAGVTLSSGGALIGTPTGPTGSFSFTVKAIDANGCPGTRTYFGGVLVSPKIPEVNVKDVAAESSKFTIQCAKDGGLLSFIPGYRWSAPAFVDT